LRSQGINQAGTTQIRPIWSTKS